MTAAPVDEQRSPQESVLTPKIGLAGDWVIGAANADPALSLSVTLAAIVAATAYGSGPVILLCAYLGWLTGWLMIMANLIGNVAAVTVLAPSVLAVAGQNQNARWPNIIMCTCWSGPSRRRSAHWSPARGSCSPPTTS